MRNSESSWMNPFNKKALPLKEGLFLTNYTMAINQNDYHYWEGSFKGLLPKEILKLSDEDFQTLYEEFIEAKINLYCLKGYIKDKREDLEENEDYLYRKGKVLKQIFKDFLQDINSDYFNYFDTAKEVDLFRSISVNEIEEISFDDKGICWTYNANTLSNYIEGTVIPHNKYLTRFYGTTSIENIDWIESFFLYINYGTQEKELRVYDSQKVFLKGYVNIDFSTMMEYSKGGETSYLLNGVITKESLLKKRESLLKEFLYNPQTDRYDYDGGLDRDKLENFISEDKDGFTINFGKITGNFDCSELGLTSLKGVPTEVGGWFDCSDNRLTSLKGAPTEVIKDFCCYDNQLISLEGAPKTVGGNFDCSYNRLTSLKGAPQEIGGNFDCSNNQLTPLEGAPQTVGGWFDCSNNQLTSLKGAPTKVGESFYCSNNELTSLEGAPNLVGTDFYCKYNKLTSLKGSPKEVGGDFCCENNLNLYSLEGIGEIKGELYKDF